MGKILNIKFLLVLAILVTAFLRLYKISANPPSLFGDEVDLGYQAYSISKTGRDYQGNFMPLHFHSLAEYRTPLYLYSAVPSVSVFGITPLGVRLPAAIFGILGIYVFYLMINQATRNQKLGLIAASLLAVSPWHLQYSRAGFEVTLMLLLLTLGLYYFFRSLNSGGKLLWLSVLLFTLTPLVYSTAKLFTPFLMLSLFMIYRKEIASFGKSNQLKAVIAGLLIGMPIVVSTLFGGGTQRFNYISVFSDPTTEAEVGFSRQVDARVRGESGAGLTPTLIDRVIHNKFTFWGDKIAKNYLQAFSTEFLFIKGDPDPRQSIGIGEFYRIEFIFLILGIIYFFTSKILNSKFKILIASWLILAPIPSAITRDGGNHATRLILMLPPLVFLISFGLFEFYSKISLSYKKYFIAFVFLLYAISFGLYAHEYYVHYPWMSERWWHYGWAPAITEIKSIDKDYDRVIISMSGEPAWIFFAGYYQYDPKTWQTEYPIGRDAEIPGFGKISHTGKFYFGSPTKDVQIYGLGRYIDSKTLYLSNATEVGANLIMEPNRVPEGLQLIKSIAYPSGEPSMYLFSGLSPK